MKLRMWMGGALAALMAGTSLSAAPAPLAEDAKLFGSRQSASQVSISPSGSKVVMLVPGPGRSTQAQLFDLVSGTANTVVASPGNPESLDWCQFASETQLVCRYGGNADVNGQILGFSRLVTVGIDGKQLKMMGQSQSFYDAGLRQFDGSILDWLPDSNGVVLMARNYVPEVGRTGSNLARTKAGLGVDRIELPSLKLTQVERPDPTASGYMTDGKGNIRIRIKDKTDNNGLLTGITNYSYRQLGSRDWTDLGTYDARAGTGFYPLAIEADTNSLFGLRKLNGRQALYRMTLDGSGKEELIAKNDKVDISGVSRVGRGLKVIAYNYSEEMGETVYFDPEFDKLAGQLGRALPGAPLIDFVGSSSDGQKLLIFAGSDVKPGTYYLLDRNTREMSELADVRPGLKSRTLNPVKPVQYTARDGASIPAYVTTPAGSSGQNLPAVVLPHGGPSSRDEWGFDWLAQFIASRGYVVIQPNYRGSSGFGDEFENVNGFKNWRTAISDVTDSAHYLVKAGIADPKRLAIVGWSYGGYAALQSAALEPDLFKSVVAIAPVTDLSLLKNDAKGFTNAQLVKEFVGSGEHVLNGSPLRHAAAIKAPVLLVHGDLDSNVGIIHSTRMAGALKSGGKQVEMLSYKGLDHYLEDSNARIEMLTKMGQLLERSIGQ